jgi:ABC-type hemin transport system ATPase subunit
VLSTLDLLRHVAADVHCAVLASLHDLAQAAAFDRVLLIDQGKVVLDRPPEEVLGSEALRQAFRIEKSGTGWRIRGGFSPAEGPRSLP